MKEGFFSKLPFLSFSLRFSRNFSLSKSREGSPKLRLAVTAALKGVLPATLIQITVIAYKGHISRMNAQASEA